MELSCRLTNTPVTTATATSPATSRLLQDLQATQLCPEMLPCPLAQRATNSIVFCLNQRIQPCFMQAMQTLLVAVRATWHVLDTWYPVLTPPSSDDLAQHITPLPQLVPLGSGHCGAGGSVLVPDVPCCCCLCFQMS